ncbi:Ms5788A family Cys-rich leader peptide [Actinoplanes sp. NPDC049316]|uniref:Ms5788A family Cys-rich leader peptide n=1 Tax=Actinoplanes sp. NPDC049316 TaxID=3154727 RepID=UPI00341D3915
MWRSTPAACDRRLLPGWWSAVFRPLEPLVGSLPMSLLLTKRRAVDLCRVAACLCRPVL